MDSREEKKKKRKKEEGVGSGELENFRGEGE